MLSYRFEVFQVGCDNSARPEKFRIALEHGDEQVVVKPRTVVKEERDFLQPPLILKVADTVRGTPNSATVKDRISNFCQGQQISVFLPYMTVINDMWATPVSLRQRVVVCDKSPMQSVIVFPDPLMCFPVAVVLGDGQFTNVTVSGLS